jgi:isopenicillin N synthase-like dioxygenase
MSEVTVELGSGGKIPVVDLTGLQSGDFAVRKATAMSMREAFEDFGFIYLGLQALREAGLGDCTASFEVLRT